MKSALRQIIITLRDKGMSYGEIAKQLNITRSMVAGHIYREADPADGCSPSGRPNRILAPLLEELSDGLPHYSSYMAKRIGVSRHGVLRNLRYLEQEEIVVRRGQGINRRWQLVEEME